MSLNTTMKIVYVEDYILCNVGFIPSFQTFTRNSVKKKGELRAPRFLDIYIIPLMSSRRRTLSWNYTQFRIKKERISMNLAVMRTSMHL